MRCKRPDSNQSLCTRSFTAPAATWKTVSKSSNRICLPIAPAPIGWLPINCGLVLGLSSSDHEYSAGRGFKGYRTGRCHELVLVNDGSRDQSWAIIQRLAAENSRVRGINLMRNYGQHNA